MGSPSHVSFGPKLTVMFRRELVLILSPAGTCSVVVFSVVFELVGFHGEYC